MLELFSLVFFGMIVYTFLVIVPSVVEHLSTDEFKRAYFEHLASRYVNSYGKQPELSEPSFIAIPQIHKIFLASFDILYL